MLVMMKDIPLAVGRKVWQTHDIFLIQGREQLALAIHVCLITRIMLYK